MSISAQSKKTAHSTGLKAPSQADLKRRLIANRFDAAHNHAALAKKRLPVMAIHFFLLALLIGGIVCVLLLEITYRRELQQLVKQEYVLQQQHNSLTACQQKQRSVERLWYAFQAAETAEAWVAFRQAWSALEKDIQDLQPLAEDQLAQEPYTQLKLLVGGTSRTLPHAYILTKDGDRNRPDASDWQANLPLFSPDIPPFQMLDDILTDAISQANIITRDLAEKRFHMQQTRLRNLQITCAILALGVVGHLVLLYWIQGRPLRHLTQIARQVRDGDLSARATVNSGGAIHGLAADFNVMLTSLEATLSAEAKLIEQLKLQARELDLANQHKSQFIATISHELKTPLNAIIGFTDILQAGLHGPLTDKQSEYTQRMEKAGKHLLAIISDLIDLAKLDLGKLEFNLGDVDAVAETMAVVDLMQDEAKLRELSLITKLPEQASVHADSKRLRQILLNLLSNAAKFTPAGGSITVSLMQQADQWLWTVEDTGIGIPADDLETIFGDFVQLDNKLNRKQDGTGIGLALSRRLARTMGGDLFLTSEPDKGTTCHLLLPVGSVTAEEG